MATNFNGFPDDMIDPRLKGKEWFYKHSEAVLNNPNGIVPNSDYYYKSREINEIKSYAQGRQDTNRYKRTPLGRQIAGESWLATDFTPIAIIPKIREMLISQLLQREFDVQAFAVDPISLAEEDTEFTKMKLKVLARDIAKGTPLQDNPAIKRMTGEAEDLESLELSKEFGYKSTMTMVAEDATSLNEDENISDVDDKVAMEKNDKELEQSGTASDGFSQSQKGAITTKQPTDSTNMEQLEIIAGLQEKMQNAVDNDTEILDSGKTMEQTAEPQLSTITNDEFQEYHFQDEQKVGEENMEVKGEEFSARDAVVSVPDNEGKEHNVDVEQRHEEQNLETQEKEPVAADNAAPVTEEPVEGSKAMATPTSTELAGEKELGAGEDHSTYPLTGDAVEGNSADVAHSFGSTPTEVQIMDANELKEWKKVGMSPSTPTASQVSCDSAISLSALVPSNFRSLLNLLNESYILSETNF